MYANAGGDETPATICAAARAAVRAGDFAHVRIVADSTRRQVFGRAQFDRVASRTLAEDYPPHAHRGRQLTHDARRRAGADARSFAANVAETRRGSVTCNRGCQSGETHFLGAASGPLLTKRYSNMTRLIPTMCAVVLTILSTAPAASAERMTDNDVKQLLERINHDRDRFEDQLDGKLKDSIVRGPGGEVKVNRYLDDLQENVQKLRDRFKSDYAASAEVTTVLRQATDIQRYMSTLPPNFDGASEWNRLAASLGELAAVYGTTLPIPEGQQARRMNDAEVRKAADDVKKNADRFKKDLDESLKKDLTVDKATREAAVDEVDSLKKDAEKLASVIGDGKPASGEAQALLDRAAKIRAASSFHALSPAAQTGWASAESSLEKVAQAFSLSGRRP
jgi:hypothetical protein